MEISVVKGDITKVDCDAIVNPANSLMIMGGGVAGAIKRAGGKIIETEARRYAPIRIGEAIVTTAGKLKARYVIHAPTMEKPAMMTNAEKVKSAIRAAIEKALELEVSCVAFPGMGTGVGGLDEKIFVEIFFDILGTYKEKIENKNLKVVLVAFTDSLYRIAKDKLQTLSMRHR